MYAQSLQKRVEKQKQHANRNLASWFIGKFSKKTQYLRDQDEEAAQADRARRHGGGGFSSTSSSGSGGGGGGPTRGSRSNSQTKPGRISAVAAAAQSSEAHRPKPQHQRSFLRAQLLEMKRESAETLLSAQQKRMAGEAVDEVVRLGTQLGIDNSDDEDYALDESDDDDDHESVCSVDEIDDALAELNAADFRAIRKEKWLRKKAAAAAAAAAASRDCGNNSSSTEAVVATRGERAHSGGRRRSSADESAAAELHARISRASQMYADALSEIDHALHPGGDHAVEPQPLFLGAKKGPKSEWI